MYQSLYKLCFIILFYFISCSKDKNVSRAYLEQMVGDANLPSEGIYFSYPGKYSPEDKKNLVTEIILNLLNQAKTSIEIYAYSFDNPKLIESLQEARQRGVKIKIVGDTEKDYSLLIKSGFQIELWKASGLHHIKAILVDRSSFLFGTGNFSKYGLRSNYNAYFLKYLSPEEGDQVFQFLEEKYPESFLVLGEHILINSPSKGKLIQDTLIQQIQSATKEIHYLIFDHFDPIVSYALKEAAQRGVLIKAIYDSPVDPEGEYLSSLSPFIEVYRDGNEDKYKEDGIYHGGLLHHKSMLIDNKVLLSGSYNYSRSARDDNREMFIISYKPSDIEDFLEEYKRVEEHAYRVYPEVKDFLNPESIQNLSLSATNSLCIQKKIDFFPKEEALILDIQKGLFSSIIYIPIKDKKSCYPLSDRESISSGLAAFTKTVWFYDSEYFSGMNFSFRHSLQKEIYRENITLDIENINKYIYPIKVQKTPDASFIIQFKDFPISTISLLEAGKKIKTLSFEKTTDPYSYKVFSELSNSGSILLINQNFFSCLKKKEENLSDVLEFILDRYYLKSYMSDRKLEKANCYDVN